MQLQNKKYKQTTPCFNRGNHNQNCFLVILTLRVKELWLQGRSKWGNKKPEKLYVSRAS
jgi:hypothetical protein